MTITTVLSIYAIASLSFAFVFTYLLPFQVLRSILLAYYQVQIVHATIDFENVPNVHQNVHHWDCCWKVHVNVRRTLCCCSCNLAGLLFVLVQRLVLGRPSVLVVVPVKLFFDVKRKKYIIKTVNRVCKRVKYIYWVKKRLVWVF